MWLWKNNHISFWTYSRPATLSSSNNKQKILYYRIQTGACLWSNMLMTLRKTIHTLLYSLPCGCTAARCSRKSAKIHKSANASWAFSPHCSDLISQLSCWSNLSLMIVWLSEFCPVWFGLQYREAGWTGIRLLEVLVLQLVFFSHMS